MDDIENRILNFEIGIETQWTKKLALRVFAPDTCANQPAAGRKENGLKLVAARACQFPVQPRNATANKPKHRITKL